MGERFRLVSTCKKVVSFGCEGLLRVAEGQLCRVDDSQLADGVNGFVVYPRVQKGAISSSDEIRVRSLV